jgi:transposase
VAMDACGSSHHWAREFTGAGHTVGLIHWLTVASTHLSQSASGQLP